MSSLAYLTEEKRKRTRECGHFLVMGMEGIPSFPSSPTHSAFNLLTLFPNRVRKVKFSLMGIDNWLIYWTLCILKQELFDHHVFLLH